MVRNNKMGIINHEMSKVKDRDVRDYQSLQYNQPNPLNPNIRMHILHINQEPLQLVIVSFILVT